MFLYNDIYSSQYHRNRLTSRAITPEYYSKVLEAARDKDAGLAVTLERGETRLTVVFGTKGRRPRETVIQDAGAAKKVLDNALSVAEQRDGRLIDQPNLQKAMNYWRGEIAKAGLTGDYTPALVALCVDAGCDPPLSGAGVQQPGSTGADLDGFGPR